MLLDIHPDQFLPAALQAPPERVEPVDGNMPPEDISLICRMVAHFKPRTLFEFGTFLGATTYNLARHSPDDAVVYTLDLPPQTSTTQTSTTAFPLTHNERMYANKAEIGSVYRRTPAAAKITQLTGDSALFDFSRYRGLIDFIVIDASHAYENCLNDSLRAVTMRAAAGVIVWHDYPRWPGVKSALDDLQRSSDLFSSLRHVCGTAVAVLL
jgi:predicted O-methyltransferase YrrM